MASTLDKVLITLVLASLLIFIAYYGYDLFECQIAKLKYEKVITRLKVLEAPYYLHQYQRACHIK
jgi:hypothetical protein